MISIDGRDTTYPLPRFEMPVRPVHSQSGGSVSRRVFQRYYLRRGLTKTVNNCISSLNKLAVSFSEEAQSLNYEPHLLANFHFTHMAASSPIISLAQKRVLDNIILNSSRLVGRSRPSDDSFNTDIFAYTSNSDHSRVPLVAQQIALPVQPGAVDLLNSLPDHIRVTYSKLDSLLASDATHAKAAAHIPRPSVFAPTGEYPRILDRLKQLDMLDYTLAPKAVNGLFGIDKGDGTQRLILDARQANACFVPPPAVQLPTPDVFAALRTQQGVPVYAAKVDIDAFFHRFVLPDHLRPFFALPAVRAADLGLSDRYGADTMVYPCVNRLPMGWSHSVFLAQSAHEHLISQLTSLQPADQITHTSSPLLHPDTVRFGIYIDDLSLFSTNADLLAHAQNEYMEAMELHGLPVKRSKVVFPSCSGVEIVGLNFDGASHTFGLAPEKLLSLLNQTWMLLEQGCCTGLQLASLVGKWTWSCLVNRPALSVFSSVYRFINVAKGRVFSLWPTVRKELRTVAGLAPLLFTSTAAAFFPEALACDASSIGLGVTSSFISQANMNTASQAAGLLDTTVITDKERQATAVLASHSWRTVVAARWQHPLRHINEGEARSVSTAVRWVASRPSSFGSRLLLYSDSTAVAGALSKGRSSAPLLRPRVRSIAAYLLAFSFHLYTVWISSQLNPADFPSRHPRQSLKPKVASFYVYGSRNP